MIIWFVLAIFFGLIVVAIWYDKIIPPISRSISRFKGPFGELATKVAGSAGVEISIGSSEAFPANTELGKVQYHLNRFIAGKRSLARNLILLAVSIYVFVQIGLLSSSISIILIVVLVVLIHELGHFIGMKIFRYRNVHIFFIPLLGAATSGIETNPSGSQKAIVSLLGPLPGILIGTVLGILYFVTKNEILIQLAWAFIFLNAFNLLPFFPLDGGRFLESLFSSKNIRFEMTFKIVSTLGVAFIWFILADSTRFFFGLGVIFVILIISWTGSFVIASTVKIAATRLSITDDLRPNHIPLEHISSIYEILKPKLFFGANPRALAKQIYYIWQRLLNKPPSRKAFVNLIALYVLSLTIAIGATAMFMSAIILAAR
jgi:Zn-dependent protease